jgi:enoyl-CoA hydratase/carnithine racemase
VSSSETAEPQPKTLSLRIGGGVATVTLERPEVHNAFDDVMVQELGQVWRALKQDDRVRAVVLTGSGDRAFCTGVDRSSVTPGYEYDPHTYEDPGKLIGPKSQEMWKPVIAAVNGMACGGAFYLLGESDVILAAEHATFFDPHVSFGMPVVFEPILLLRRMPFGDVLRMALVGNHERVTAATALRLGLVSEVVPSADLLQTAQALATAIASQPMTAVQATLRTLWAAKDLSAAQATSLGNVFLQLGYSSFTFDESQEQFQSGSRQQPRLR